MRRWQREMDNAEATKAAKPMLTCGHAANAVVDATNAPACAICGCTDVDTAPDLTGREATCSYGDHARKPSALSLAFFRHRPDKPTDTYYCGCYGWG